MLTLGQVRSKARMAMSRREAEIEEEEVGEINLVPYLDIVTNIVLFLLATLSAGFLMGNINSALPEYADAAAGAQVQPEETEDEPALQLVVAVTKPNIRLFSISGLEGTLNAPKKEIPAIKEGLEYDYQALTEAAKEIVTRRWGPDGKTRPDGSTEVILMVDPDIRYDVVINAMDALRQSKEGIKLFPDVLFSTGIL